MLVHTVVVAIRRPLFALLVVSVWEVTQRRAALQVRTRWWSERAVFQLVRAALLVSTVLEVCQCWPALRVLTVLQAALVQWVVLVVTIAQLVVLLRLCVQLVINVQAVPLYLWYVLLVITVPWVPPRVLTALLALIRTRPVPWMLALVRPALLVSIVVQLARLRLLVPVVTTVPPAATRTLVVQLVTIAQ